ncbi:MAG TPA: hypothetical protein VK978_05180 [Candidatus Saccharimonadales bacterium]|nr:hypothetical protein [Candidatus Saccharimonadales bacterium]
MNPFDKLIAGLACLLLFCIVVTYAVRLWRLAGLPVRQPRHYYVTYLAACFVAAALFVAGIVMLLPYDQTP